MSTQAVRANPERPHPSWWMAATLAAMLAVAGGAANAQTGGVTVSEEIVGCAEIKEDAGRLACFDRAIASLVSEDDGGEAQVFSGEDGWTSEVFEMEAPWRVAWRSDAHVLTIELRDANDIFVALAGNQIGEGEGQSDVFEPGEYRLGVTATGAWRLRVVEQE